MRINFNNVARPAAKTKRPFAVGAMLLALAAMAIPARANNDPSYSYDSNQKTSHPDWMASIPDSMPLSKISTPGTHDSMAIGPNLPFGTITQTQAMQIETQLASGIRAFDIRAQQVNNSINIYHGVADLRTPLASVINALDTFLDHHCGETVLLKIAINDFSSPLPSVVPMLPPLPGNMTFEQVITKYINNDHHFWVPNTGQTGWDFPTLGAVRGKIVIIQNFGIAVDTYGNKIYHGLPASDFNGNSFWALGGIEDLYHKWTDAKNEITVAVGDTSHAYYMVGLNGAMGSSSLVTPFFVASGQSAAASNSPLLDTGALADTATNLNTTLDPDFPRGSCAGDLCSIYYQGINPLTTNYLTSLDGTAAGYRRVGLVMADFPGPALIDEVIAQNITTQRFFGNFNGNGMLSYDKYLNTWWFGNVDASHILNWTPVSPLDTTVSAAAKILTGDFTGSGSAQVLYYDNFEDWTLASIDSTGHLFPTIVGNSNAGDTNFGNLNDGRPMWAGNFSSSGKQQVVFYNPGDGNWFLGGMSAQKALVWEQICNTSGHSSTWNFGNLNDGRPFFTGDFTGSGETQIMFYNPGDGNWWLGAMSGNQMTWTLTGNSANFGNISGDKFFTGKFLAGGHDQVMFYSVSDSHWWLGKLTILGQMSWSQVGNTSNFGNLNDGRPFWTSNFSNNGNSQVMFYNQGDGNWWLGNVTSSNTMTWLLAATTPQLGDLTDGRPVLVGNLGTGSQTEVLVYTGTQGWSLGIANGYLFNWFGAGNSIL